MKRKSTAAHPTRIPWAFSHGLDPWGKPGPSLPWIPAFRRECESGAALATRQRTTLIRLTPTYSSKLCRRHLPDGGVGRRSGAVLGRSEPARHRAARRVPRAARLQRVLRRSSFAVRVDTAFAAVMRGCAEASETRPSTWINDEIVGSIRRSSSAAPRTASNAGTRASWSAGCTARSAPPFSAKACSAG